MSSGVSIVYSMCMWLEDCPDDGTRYVGGLYPMLQETCIHALYTQLTRPLTCIILILFNSRGREHHNYSAAASPCSCVQQFIDLPP